MSTNPSMSQLVTSITNQSLGEYFVSPLPFWNLHGIPEVRGSVVVSKTAAFLVTDSCYLLQAWTELNLNWHLIPAGAMDGPKNSVGWLVVRASRGPPACTQCGAEGIQ
jgi:hypothetical protein